MDRTMVKSKSRDDKRQQMSGGPVPWALLALLVMLLLRPPLAESGENDYTKPAEKDKCPVCGMFVAKYPDWVAQIRFKDGGYAVFDGPKDLFKYLADLKRYAPNRRQEDLKAVYVTDYYAVTPIDGSTAYYVTGSDVYGPMGAEFIPFEKETDAREFLKDHGGKRILRFRDITPAVLKGVE
jgi:nitrous oxide reductase accessory protein NosL